MPITCLLQDLSETPRRFARLYYQTPHALADVMAPGYFAPAASFLRCCDIIDVWAQSDTDPVYQELVVVEIVAGGDKEHSVTVRPLSELRAARTGRARPVGTAKAAGK